jgi:hypothetical protein
MSGVPASKRCGIAANVVPESVTDSIIEPPVRNGGIASSSAARPHSTPTPDGPNTLWPANT